MPLHNLRKIISGRSLDHRDDDTKSVSSPRTSPTSSRRRRFKLVSPTAANRPTLGAFFNVSKQQVNVAQRSILNRQKELDVRKNRKSSILASLDCIDSLSLEIRDEATAVTANTVPISDHSISSHMSPERRSRSPSAQRKHTKRHDSSQSVGGEQASPLRKDRRYRRRGSVTKFSPDDQQDGSSREFDNDSASMLSIGVNSVQSDSFLQNSGSPCSTIRPRYGDRDDVTTTVSVVTTNTVPVSDHITVTSAHMSLEERMSRPPLAQRKHKTRHDSSQSVGGEAPPLTERYRRRGSVTKVFSLDDKQDGSSREFDDSASMLSIGVDSVQSDSFLQNSRSASTNRPRYRRRGSVTKFSLEATEEEQQVKQPKQSQAKIDSDDNVSVSSFGGDSDNAPPPRYRRRNSVLKPLLESTTEHHAPKKDTLSTRRSSNTSLPPVSSTIVGGDNGSFSSLGNVSALCNEDDLGYGSLNSASPPPRVTPSPDPYGYGEETDSVSQCPPPRKERHHRRGSVTKYSLEAQDQVKKELQAGSTRNKELEDSYSVDKELDDSSTRPLQFEELVARYKSSTEASRRRPPRHPLKNRLVPSQPIS